jgi:hypothetical protein
MMTRTGPDAEVPTYVELENILREHGHDWAPRTIRNRVNDLRVRLTYEHGVDQLLGADAPESGSQQVNYLPTLAAWAVRSGNVTDLDLESLEADERDGARGGSPGRSG